MARSGPSTRSGGARSGWSGAASKAGGEQGKAMVAASNQRPEGRMETSLLTPTGVPSRRTDLGKEI